MKYDNLSLFLNGESRDEIRMNFSYLESILGFQLPKSAYTYTAWWANGGHTQAEAWLYVGYHVVDVSLTNKYVVFKKIRTKVPGAEIKHGKTIPTEKEPVRKQSSQSLYIFGNDKIRICGYDFRFIQEIMPKCDSEGKIIDYYPQNNYPEKEKKMLNQYGAGAFCSFTIDAEDVPGVYLWVVDGEIIYIGETIRLRQRFNTGYGTIQPRNCYIGGQTTNCKMNKVVRSLYIKGKLVRLYFYQTHDYKRVELELLNKYKTRYNVKDNI